MRNGLKPGETRYRLRDGTKIVGYMREMGGGGSQWFSKDQFWWNGAMIAHEHVDECIGLKDRNNRFLFELDIVEYAMGDRRDRLGALLWSHKQDCWLIKDLDDHELLVPLDVEGLSLFDSQDLKFHAFLFTHPDLMVELGVRDD